MGLDGFDVEEKASVAAEKLIEGERDGDKVEVDKRNSFDEALEKNLNTSGVFSEEEVEYLKNNSQGMSNDELKEFLTGQSSFQQENDFERFSQSEEKFLMKSFPGQDAESIAENLNRSVEDVERKIKMLGLGHEL